MSKLKWQGLEAKMLEKPQTKDNSCLATRSFTWFLVLNGARRQAPHFPRLVLGLATGLGFWLNSAATTMAAPTMSAQKAQQAGLPVPQLVARTPQTMSALLADLGLARQQLVASVHAGSAAESASSIGRELPAGPSLTVAELLHSSPASIASLTARFHQADGPAVPESDPAPTLPTSAPLLSAAQPPAASPPATAPLKATDPTRIGSDAKARVPQALVEIKPQAALHPARPQPASATAQPQLALPSQASTSSTINLTAHGESLTITPSSLTLASGASTRVDLHAGLTMPSVFVRHGAILTWQAATAELKAKAPGRTEVYVLYGNKMHILPVVVTASKQAAGAALADLDDLATPAFLTDLTALPVGQSAQMPGPLNELSLQAKPQAPAAPSDAGAPLPQAFQAETQAVAYTKIAIRVVDERSTPHAKKPLLFPVAGVDLRLVGTSFVAKTGANGFVNELSVPTNSRLLVSISDPSGTYKPTVAEVVSSHEPNSGVFTIKVLRSFVEQGLLEAAALNDNPGRSSLCADVLDAQGAPLAGVRVDIDWQEVYPYYFNDYGFPDTQQASTGRNGRFCFLNVPPGSAALSFYEGKQLINLVPVVLFAGHHLETSFRPDELTPLATFLASLPTAHELRNLSEGEANSYRRIEMVDLLPYGGGDPFTQEHLGYLHTSDPLGVAAGRGYYLVDSADFEPTLYQYDVERHRRRNHVTALVPRGFVEDMAYYADLVHEPEFGSVLIEHGSLAGQGSAGKLQIHLIDYQGRDVGDGIYFGEEPVRKAMFFNVPDGLYTVLIETADENWVKVDTVMVYQGTLSYLRTGSQLLGHLPAAD